MTHTTTSAAKTQGTIPRHPRGLRDRRRLPPDHPALAYVDDATALVDLIRDEPDLFSGDDDRRYRELEFLRDFVRDFAGRAQSPSSSSSSSSMDEKGEEVALTIAAGGDGGSHGVNVEDGAGMDLDEDGGFGGGGGDGGGDGHGHGRAMDEEDEDDDGDEGGYWDDEEDDGDAEFRDRYVWPPRPPPSSPGPDSEGDCDPKCGREGRLDDEDDVEAYECVVIGAGAAGVGVSVALVAGGMKRRNLLVVESHTVGSSFDSWPPRTRFISPSVYSNPFGGVDLNAVDPWSSPALEALSMVGVDRGVSGRSGATGGGGGGKGEEGDAGIDVEGDFNDDFDTQHLSGAQYAEYLRRVASRWSLPVRENCTVTGVRRLPPGRTTDSWKFGCFEIDITETKTEVDRRSRRRECRRRRDGDGDGVAEKASAAIGTAKRRGSAKKTIYSRFVVWCGGEWCHPKIPAGLSSTMGWAEPPKMAPPPTETVLRPPSRTSTPSSSSPSSVDGSAGQNNDSSAEAGDPAEEAKAGYVHYSHVGSTKEEWRDLVRRANGGVNNNDDGGGEGFRGGGHAVVVGAFEAGVDATCTLVELGVERVTVVEESCDVPQCWVGAVVATPDSADDIVDGARTDGDGGPASGGTTTSRVGSTEILKKKGRAGEREGRVVSSDPSVSLSATSARRIRSAVATGRVTLLPGRRLVGVDVDVVEVGAEEEEAVERGHHRHDDDDDDDDDRIGPPDGRGGGRVDRGCAEGTRRRCWFVARVERTSSSAEGVVKGKEEVLPPSSAPVVLCTGFDPGRSCPVLASLVDWDSPPPPTPRSSEDYAIEKVTTTSERRQRHRKHGNRNGKHHGGPLVSEGCDESLRVPGFFVCGPMLRHTAAAARRRGGGRETNNVPGGGGAAIHCPPWTQSGSRLRGHRRKGTEPVKSNIAEDGQQLSNDGDDADEEEEEEEQTIIFCFIYKFRTRFALVAGEILSRLVLEDHCVRGGQGEDDGGQSNIRIDRVGHERLSRVEDMLRWYQEKGMLLKDLSCATCEDVRC